MPALETLRQRIAERPWRAGLYAFAALALATSVLLAVDHVLRPEVYPVRSMSFEGEFRQVDEQALAAAVVDVVRGNFFLLDLENVRRHVLKLPWVYQATVHRRWPDGVHIRFSEQQLVARWGAKGWVNAVGDYVDLKDQPGPDGVPVLSGPDGMQARVLGHYRRLNTILEPAGLQVASLTLTPRHAWNVVLSNRLVLTLGREEPEPKVARFAHVYPRALAAQANSIRRIDLRYTNGFSVEWINRAATPRAAEIVATSLNEG